MKDETVTVVLPLKKVIDTFLNSGSGVMFFNFPDLGYPANGNFHSVKVMQMTAPPQLRFSHEVNGQEVETVLVPVKTLFGLNAALLRTLQAIDTKADSERIIATAEQNAFDIKLQPDEQLIIRKVLP